MDKRQFATVEEALRAGYNVALPDGWYTRGGEEIRNEDFPGLWEAATGQKPEPRS